MALVDRQTETKHATVGYGNLQGSSDLVEGGLWGLLHEKGTRHSTKDEPSDEISGEEGEAFTTVGGRLRRDARAGRKGLWKEEGRGVEEPKGPKARGANQSGSVGGGTEEGGEGRFKEPTREPGQANAGESRVERVGVASQSRTGGQNPGEPQGRWGSRQREGDPRREGQVRRGEHV